IHPFSSTYPGFGRGANSLRREAQTSFSPATCSSSSGGIPRHSQASKGPLSSKNGKKPDSGSSSSSSFFTWFIVLALLGVWTSVAVVYFDLVDYQGVLGGYDALSAMFVWKRYLGCGQGEAQVLDWLEEVEEGGSDWLNSFFTFLFGEDEEEDEEEVRQRGAKDDENKGQKIVIVGLHNQ
uniref:Aspartyl beta-hydroxylase/Triadin domain-containing protein n=1 Tax=Xiphophorus couchianus TaxID=32473 RepID=A0A3B5LB82_9TELE